LAWSELKIGVLTIAAIIVAAVTIFAFIGGSGFYWQRYSLKTRFTNVVGLSPGSPVRLAGVLVGSVSEVTLVGSDIDITFKVNRRYQQYITTSSVARLGAVSLLGQSAVDITPDGGGATPIPEWGYVPAGRGTAALSDMTDQTSQGINDLTALIRDVREGRGLVGKLMTDEELYAEFNRFVTSATALTQGLRDGQGTIGKLIADPSVANSLQGTLANLETMTRQLNAGEGSLGTLLHNDAFARSLSDATSNINTLLSSVNRGEGTAGKLINDPAVFNQLDSITKRLDQLVAGLNDGNGTVGQLLKDGQLYENINGTMNDLRTLIANINKDPRKYLNIRVSIF
jgi:phospholipid/cholesterol/gamma-HCH transport system substrate-binding protein